MELLVTEPKRRAVVVAPDGDRRRRVRNPEVPRSKTVAVKRISRDELAAHEIEIVGFTTSPAYANLLDQRPRTRGDCAGGQRPCPWISCQHHLYLDINPETGSIKINFPDLEPWELADTCSLDVAERGGITLEEVATVMNLTRERIRQVEVRALLKYRAAAVERDLLGRGDATSDADYEGVR